MAGSTVDGLEELPAGLVKPLSLEQDGKRTLNYVTDHRARMARSRVAACRPKHLTERFTAGSTKRSSMPNVFARRNGIEPT